MTDKLREALDNAVIFDQRDNIRHEMGRASKTSRAIRAAARAYLEGTSVSWCEEHLAMDIGLHVREGICSIAAHRENPTNSGGNCRMVSRRLVVEIEED